MPTTSPDNLWSPDNSDNFEDLVSDLATMQGSVQQAFNNRAIKTYKWDDAAARNAQTGMSAGDTGYQIDTDTMYRFDGDGWVQFSHLPVCIVRKGTSQSLTSGTLTWTDPVYNPDGMWSSSNNTVINIPVDGLYEVQAYISQSGVVAATLQVFSNEHGIIGHGSSAGTSGAASNPRVVLTTPLSGGDYVYCTALTPSTVSWQGSPLKYPQFSVRCVEMLR